MKKYESGSEKRREKKSAKTNSSFISKSSKSNEDAYLSSDDADNLSALELEYLQTNNDEEQERFRKETFRRDSAN